MTLWVSFKFVAIGIGLAVIIGLWLAFLWTERRWPAGLRVRPMQIEMLLSAVTIILFETQGLKGLWPYTRLGLVAAGLLSAGPLSFSGARDAFAATDPAYPKAARSMGASEWSIFSLVQMPLAFRKVLFQTFATFLTVGVEFASVWWFVKGSFR
jgi:molybdate transport system permease protein